MRLREGHNRKWKREKDTLDDLASALAQMSAFCQRTAPAFMENASYFCSTSFHNILISSRDFDSLLASKHEMIPPSTC